MHDKSTVSEATGVTQFFYLYEVPWCGHEYMISSAKKQTLKGQGRQVRTWTAVSKWVSSLFGDTGQ